jgi:hypothetical protein
MVKTKQKAEIQALSSFGFQYLSEEPQRSSDSKVYKNSKSNLIHKKTTRYFSKNEGGVEFAGGIPISSDGRRACQVLSLPEMCVRTD